MSHDSRAKSHSPTPSPSSVDRTRQLDLSFSAKPAIPAAAPVIQRHDPYIFAGSSGDHFSSPPSTMNQFATRSAPLEDSKEVVASEPFHYATTPRLYDHRLYSSVLVDQILHSSVTHSQSFTVHKESRKDIIAAGARALSKSNMELMASPSNPLLEIDSTKPARPVPAHSNSGSSEPNSILHTSACTLTPRWAAASRTPQRGSSLKRGDITRQDRAEMTGVISPCFPQNKNVDSISIEFLAVQARLSAIQKRLMHTLVPEAETINDTGGQSVTNKASEIVPETESRSLGSVTRHSARIVWASASISDNVESYESLTSSQERKFAPTVSSRPLNNLPFSDQHSPKKIGTRSNCQKASPTLPLPPGLDLTPFSDTQSPIKNTSQIALSSHLSADLSLPYEFNETDVDSNSESAVVDTTDFDEVTNIKSTVTHDHAVSKHHEEAINRQNLSFPQAAQPSEASIQSEENSHEIEASQASKTARGSYRTQNQLQVDSDPEDLPNSFMYIDLVRSTDVVAGFENDSREELLPLAPHSNVEIIVSALPHSIIENVSSVQKPPLQFTGDGFARAVSPTNRADYKKCTELPGSSLFCNVSIVPDAVEIQTDKRMVFRELLETPTFIDDDFSSILSRIESSDGSQNLDGLLMLSMYLEEHRSTISWDALVGLCAEIMSFIPQVHHFPIPASDDETLLWDVACDCVDQMCSHSSAILERARDLNAVPRLLQLLMHDDAALRSSACRTLRVLTSSSDLQKLVLVNHEATGAVLIKQLAGFDDDLQGMKLLAALKAGFEDCMRLWGSL
jgi:hypothetical protein